MGDAVSGYATALGCKEADRLTQELEALDEERKRLSAEIGEIKEADGDIAPLVAQHRELSERIDELRAEETDTEQPAGRLDTEIVTDLGVFADMQSEWNDLVERSDCYSPFLLWEWLYPWWEIFGDDRELFLVVARRGRRLEGIAPLMVGLRRGGKLDKRVLGLIGTGERAEGDYFDFIVSHEASSQVRNALWRAATNPIPKYGVMELAHVAVGDEGPARLVQAAAADGAHVVVKAARNAVVGPLPSSFEEFLGQVPNKNRRYYLRYQYDQLRCDFDKVQHCVARNEDDLDRVLAAMQRFSCGRLQAYGRGSAWADERFRRCLKEASRLLLARGCLRAETLAVEGEVVAALLGFVHRDTYFCYQMAFNDAYAAYGPGHCLLGQCIRACIQAGLKRFDFLGGEHQYKCTYFRGRKRLVNIAIFQPSAANLRNAGMDLLGRACKLYLKSLLRRRSGG